MSHRQDGKQHRPVRTRFLLLVLVLAGLVALIVSHRYVVYDHIRLLHYRPPASIAQLALDDTMTSATRQVFYVNHPALEDKSAFAPHCPSGTEQTVVLGCYQSNQDGIYLLKVSDPRLQGIVQVTAAHETLHAEYDRLSANERARVDAMLLDYYHHGLIDPTIKSTIAAYQKSEPNDVVDEMHSVFATEVTVLPANLEDYYQRYFTDRNKVTAYYTAYQAEFTSRQAIIAADDSKLAAMKSEIINGEADLKAKQTSITIDQQRLQQLRTSGDTTAYNAGVPAYNSEVDGYNNELQTIKGEIAAYNQLVSDRNQLALEEQQLVQAISSQVPSLQQQ